MHQLLLIFVDESLSMRARKNEVLAGINQFIDVQREINPDSRLILIKFNNNVTVLHKGTKISEVNPLRSIDYNPAGRTALFDAIHLGIELAEEIKRSDERVTCILITDGEDNASKQNVSCKTTKKLVKKYDIKADWSFTYIGKPTEYWHRTKPVSKVSYESNVPRFQRYNSSVALRRMRSAALSAVASNGSQTSLVCQ